jgi:hypothetical protein
MITNEKRCVDSYGVKGHGWTAVRDLKSGDIIETCNGIRYINQSKWAGIDPITEIHAGATVTVKLVSESDSHETVYNLHVEDFYTYFVGAEGLWVHNTKDIKADVLGTKENGVV